MPNNVLHILRKSTQLRATFIKNQITNHLRYSPFIVFKESTDKPYDGGYADFENKKFKILNLGEGKKERNKRPNKYIKRISKFDAEKILSFIKLNSIDILHLHYGTDAGLYKKIVEQSGLPSIISFYGYEVSSFPRMFLGLGKHYLKRKVFNTSSKILAMTEDMKNDLLKLECDESKIIVHYHGVDGSIYYNPTRKYYNRDKIILLIVSYLTPQKGHKFLLEAVKEIIKRGYKNFELRIVGTGELEFELKEYVSYNNLNSTVKFLGAMKAHSPEILREYKNADIFTHPSVIPENGDKEGIPGTVVEAMFSGLPVVSTFHAGIPHIIENGKTGLLVKEWNVEELADSILFLIQNVNMREKIGKSAQKYAIENLNLSIKEAELEKIYDSVKKNFGIRANVDYKS
jgi:colanic acid/amylovoran biosynthesis glycosyltransferase